MHKRRRAIRPAVEAIESRTLLSAGIDGAATAGALILHRPAGPVHLHGTLQGQFHTDTPFADAGTTYLIDGKGRVGGFGRVTVTGEVHSLGFVLTGHAQGDLTLKKAGGTITLHLLSPVQQTGFQPLPSVFVYGITSGTGRYRAVYGMGSATLNLTPPPIGTNGLPTQQGQFTLVVTPRALPL